MKKETLSFALNSIDDKFIEEANSVKASKKKSIIVKITAVAACLAMALAVGVPAVIRSQNAIELSESSNGVRAHYFSGKISPSNMSQNDCLIFLSEEEIFTHFPIAIFKGQVEKIDNIELSFNGDKAYRAIAEIKIEKVYKGDCKQGETAKILLPCPISDNTWTEDCDTIEKLKVGDTGIFMPIQYDDTMKWEQNGATVILKDITPYGLADGARYAFIENKNGLYFGRDHFPSIENAESLEEIEPFIIKMAEK